jgi:hypothetical protein
MSTPQADMSNVHNGCDQPELKITDLFWENWMTIQIATKVRYTNNWITHLTPPDYARISHIYYNNYIHFKVKF